MPDLLQAPAARRAAARGAASAVAGLAAGLGIAGVPLGGLLTPIALALWLRVASRSPGLASWLAQHAVLGLFTALGSGHWVPGALVSLGTPPPAAALLSAGLAVWHGALPFTLIALLSHPTRSRHRGLQVAGHAAAVYAIETLVSRSGLFVPWVLLGHSQTSDTPLASLATLGGVPTISAALAGLAASATRSLDTTSGSTRRWQPLPFPLARRVGGFGVGLLVFGLLIRTPPGQPDRGSGEPAQTKLRVLAIQPNFPASGRWDPPSQPIHANRMGAYSGRALDAHAPRPDLVLWPENTVTWGPDSADPRRLVSAWAARLDVALIAGLAVREASPAAHGYRNLLVWFGRDGRILDAVDKEVAVPGLERLPADAWWSRPARALLGPAAAGPSVAGHGRMRSLRADATSHGRITQLLCFEALFPALVARRRTPETMLLLNPSDDRWAGAPGISRQLARYASFRAIEQRLPLVRVAHAGLTVLYDAHGRELEALPPRAFGALAFAVDRPAPLREARRAVAAALLAGVGAGSAAGLAARVAARIAARVEARVAVRAAAHVEARVAVGWLAGLLALRWPAGGCESRRHGRSLDGGRGSTRAPGCCPLHGLRAMRINSRRRLLVEVARPAQSLARSGRQRKRRPAIRTAPVRPEAGPAHRDRAATTRSRELGPRAHAPANGSPAAPPALARELLMNERNG